MCPACHPCLRRRDSKTVYFAQFPIELRVDTSQPDARLIRAERLLIGPPDIRRFRWFRFDINSVLAGAVQLLSPGLPFVRRGGNVAEFVLLFI